MPNSTITALERARHLIASDKFPFKLADLQVSDILEAIPAERFAWNLEVGCGKTPCSTMTALAWDESHTIVAVPPIIIDSWAAWLKLIGETDIGIYRGPRRTQSLLNHKWVLMSHAIFRDSFETIQHFYTNKSLSLIIDESQHLKNPQSKLFKCVYKLAQPDRRIQLLTGTPTSKPQDTYAYMRIKTPNLYRSYGHWQNMHVDEVDIFKTITKYKNLDLLAENFAIKAVKRTKQEIFGHNLDPIFQPMEYELAPKHAALYKKLAEEQLLLLDNGDKIDATTAQRLRHALQQIVCNYGKFSGNPEHVSSAYDLLDQVIEEVDPIDQSKSKLVIWTYYVATSEAVTAYLREKYGVEAVAAAYGKVDSNKGVEAIMHNPKCRFLVAQPSSAGVGLNLHHVCSEMLFLEMSTSPMQVRQAIGRTDRVGQKVRPTIRFGQAKGTIQLKLFQDLLKNDTLVTQVERTKKSLRDEIFGITA